MKNLAINIVFCTGAALVILGIFFVIFDTEQILVSTIFQIFGANIIINIGILLLHKIEFRYVVLEYLLDISCIILVLVTFGFIFDWYSVTPIWVLIIMAVIIYMFVIIASIVNIRKKTKEINELLQKRKEKMEKAAS
ncbi:MAG: hypothetical protein LBU88_09085 [Treponema sp.]|jgi:hypothetical protein|nr:hypothetical protein [Treponema sp.]